MELNIEPRELKGFSGYIENSPTFKKYQSKSCTGKEECIEYGGDIYSVSMFYQMGGIDVFTHDLKHGVTGMSGNANRNCAYTKNRNTHEHKADVLADLMQARVVKEANDKYISDYPK